MSKPKIKIINCETNEEIIREMDDIEFAQYKLDREAQLEKDLEEQAKAAARQAILDRLGLTEEEARLLLG